MGDAVPLLERVEAGDAVVDSIGEVLALAVADDDELYELDTNRTEKVTDDELD